MVSDVEHPPTIIPPTIVPFPLSPQAGAVVLNGVRSRLSLDNHGDNLSHWQRYRHVIVTDGAWDDFSQTSVARGLHNAPSQPQTPPTVLTILGDGDSIRQRPPQFIETPNQDFTDFEKALQYATAQGLSAVDVFWASGGEMDHFLGNLSVAAKYATTINTRFFDGRQCYFLLMQTTATDQQTTVISGINNRGVSLYPFPEARLSSRGLRYELDDLLLNQHRQQSLRNHAIADRVVLHWRGNVWVFISLSSQTRLRRGRLH